MVGGLPWGGRCSTWNTVEGDQEAAQVESPHHVELTSRLSLLDYLVAGYGRARQHYWTTPLAAAGALAGRASAGHVAPYVLATFLNGLQPVSSPAAGARQAPQSPRSSLCI